MIYKGRSLRSLWEVELYVGNPDAKKPKTKKETIIALNAVDALRKCGGNAAVQPERLDYVTWPEKDGETVLIIRDTSGPTDNKANPTIAIVEE